MNVRTLSSSEVPADLQDFPEDLIREPVITTPYHNRSDINARHALVQPDEFTQKEGLETNLEKTGLTLEELEKEKLQLIAELLNSPRLQELIEAGKITVALVKPQIHKGKMGETDEVLANRILRTEIKPPLQILFSLPTHMTPSDVRNFYQSVYDLLSSKPDPETSGKSTVWDRHQSYMTSGAITMVLLYCKEGNAVDEWRRQLGPTKPDQDIEGRTIRGRYGWDIRGNIGHGSNGDSPEEKTTAVHHETGWMRDKINNLLQNIDSFDVFMQEEHLRELGILEEGDIFLATEQFIPKQKVSSIGCSFSAYITSFINKDGKTDHRRFIVKHFDEMTETEINLALAEAENERMRLFAKLLTTLTPNKFKKTIKTSTPRIYSIAITQEGFPSITREYINSNNRIAASIIGNLSFSIDKKMEILDGLIYAAALLDVAGVKSKNLPENFLYDGSKWIYIGGASIEIQSPSQESVSTGIADLLQWFGNNQELANEIRIHYKKYQTSLSGKRQQLGV